MSLLDKYHDPVIRFLMDRKYPYLKSVSTAPEPIVPLSDRRHTDATRRITTVRAGGLTPEGAKAVAQYESELRALSRDELHGRYEQETAKATLEHENAVAIREQIQEKRLWNEWASADFSYWLQMPAWTPDEAIDVSLGKEPGTRFGWAYVERFTQISAFARKYEKRRRLVHRAVQERILPSPMPPRRFAEWALSIHLEVPDELKPQVAQSPRTTESVPATPEVDSPERKRPNLTPLKLDAATPEHESGPEAARTADDEISALFDPVTVQELEAIFPAHGKWLKWRERAKDNGLAAAARRKRGKFDPYHAGKWFLAKGEKGWSMGRVYRALANNMPARSGHMREWLMAHAMTPEPE